MLYIRVTNNIGHRFVEHRIIERYTAKPRDSRIVWIHKNAGSKLNAKNIEKVFLDRLPGKIRTSFCREKTNSGVCIYSYFRSNK